MDYNELLFAYHVRNDVLQGLARDFPDGLTSQDMDIEIDARVEAIVNSTKGIARRIAKLTKA